MRESRRGDGPTWVILGAGGHARSVADTIDRAGGRVVAVAGVTDGAGWSVPTFGTDREALLFAKSGDHHVGLGVGDNQSRAALVRMLEVNGLRTAPVVAATATLAASAHVGMASALLEHSHVGANASVGRGVIINTAAIVEHDCRVADAVHIAPGACLLGGVRVGNGALIGSGARVLPGVALGAGAIVAAGAVVTIDVADGQTVTGVPARARRS